MRRGPDCPSDLVLDRLRAGELRRDAHVDGCADCQARLREMEAVRAEILSEPMPRRRPPRRWPIAAAALVAAAAGLLIATRLPDGTRVKGGARLGFHVKRGETVWRGEEGERVRPGDALRFSVAPRGRRWIAILSRDGAGHASVYQPPLAVGGKTALPLAIALDDVLGRELIVGLFCDEAPDVEALRRRLERDADLAAPPGCEVDRLHLEKERAP